VRRAHRAVTLLAAGVAIALAWSGTVRRTGSPGDAAPRIATTPAVADGRAPSAAERLRTRGRGGSADAADLDRPEAGGSPIGAVARGTARPPPGDRSTVRDGRPPRALPDAEARRDPSLRWPVLDAVEPVAGRLTARVAGHDPVGDRAVVLWRRAPQGAVRLASVRSDADGAFDFGEIPVPNGGEALAVTAGATDPLLPAVHVVEPARLSPPAVVARVEDDAVAVVFHPAVLAGELIVLDDLGRVAARLDAATRPGWTLPADARARDHHVVHVLPDGRRSASALVYEAP
jgi:hypothetical protein